MYREGPARRAIFLVNPPIIAVLAAALPRLLPRDAGQARTRLDVAGAALVTLSVPVRTRRAPGRRAERRAVKDINAERLPHHALRTRSCFGSCRVLRWGVTGLLGCARRVA
jgi:hypothetical protein